MENVTDGGDGHCLFILMLGALRCDQSVAGDVMALSDPWDNASGGQSEGDNFTDGFFTNLSLNHSDDVASEQVLFGSALELTITMSVWLVLSAVAVLLEASVVATIALTSALHEPHFAIMLVFCIGDIVVVLTICISLLAKMLTATVFEKPYLTVIGISTAFGVTLNNGLIAYERYLYFCRPLHYPRLFTRGRTALVVLAIYAFPLAYVGATQAAVGRTYHASSLFSHLPQRFFIVVNVILFPLPSAIASVYSMVKIWLLLVVKNQVAPAPGGVMAAAGGGGQATPYRQARKGLRMLLLVSGSYWGSYLPTFIIRLAIQYAGYTLKALDERHGDDWLAPLVALRGSTLLFSVFAPLVNPLIYYYSRRDLRRAALALLGRRPRPADPAAGSSSQQS